MIAEKSACPSSRSSTSGSIDSSWRRSFRLRHVVLVHDGAHIAEQQVLGEWGRNVGRHIDQTDVSRLNVRHDATQRGHVVIVLQAFAGGFQQQRVIAFQPRGVQQLRGTQSLLP